MKPLSVTVHTFLLGLLGMATDALPGAPPDDNKIRTIVTRGERVDLEGYVVEGKFTLFEFYADWSSAWKEMAPRMEAQVRSADDVVLRRINVRSWSSPVVSQHGIKALPHYKLYDPAGKLMKAYSPDGADTPGRVARTPPPRRRSPGSSGISGSPGPSGVSGSSSRRSPPVVSAPKVMNICPRGEKVDLENHLVKGQYTLFEFYADW